MSSAFQFINEKQLPDKSEPSSSTKANTPKTGANDGIIASSASKATPKLDKSKPLSFDSGSTLSFGSDKQTSSSFAFLNKPAVVNADPDKDKASNLDFGFGAPANKPVSTQPANTGSGGFGSLSIRPTSFGGFGQSKRANTRTEGSFGTIQPLPATTDKEKPITQPRKTLLGQKSKFGTPVNNQPRQTFSGFGSKPSQPLVSLTFGSIKPFPLSLSQKPAPSQQSQQAIISSPSPNTTTASTPTATEGSKVSTTTSPEQSSPLSSNTTNTSTATLDANKTKTNFSSSFNTKDKLVAQSQASLVAASASTSTTQAVPNNYASLLEEIADNDALDQPQRSQSVPASNTNKTMTDRLSCSETNLTDASHSAFPFINDGGSKSVFSDKPPFTLYKWIDNEPPKTSAFGFINQGSPTLSGSFDFSVASIQSHLSDMFIFGSPPTSTSPAPPVTFSSSILHSEKDSETKLLSANTSWRTFQINKQKELDIIQGLYNKESQTQDMVKQLKEKLAQIDTEKADAIASENYSIAQKLAIECASMQYSLQTLQDVNLHTLQTNIRASWQRMAALLKKESALAERVVESTTKVKQDKHRYLVRLEEDHERLHRAQVQDLEMQRADVDQLKSEVAFDHDMVKQNETDLNERMDEAVMEETEKMTQLESKSRILRTEVESLRQKLKELESEEKNAYSEIEEVKSVIEIKLKPFEVEQKELEYEKNLVEQRQTQIKETESTLNEKDATADVDMTRIRQVKECGEKEITDFDKRIENLASRQEKSKTELDQLNGLITKKIQGLEATVMRHKLQIKKSRAIIARKNNEIVSLQNRLYQGEQSRINLDEKIAKIITQKESLTRRKELALKNEHYTNAEVLSSQIKELGVSLVQFQEEQDRTGGSALDIEKLDQEKEKLLALEKELESLEKTCVSELRTVLESLKEELEKKLKEQLQRPLSEDDNDILKTLIECELTFVQSKLDTDDLLSYF